MLIKNRTELASEIVDRLLKEQGAMQRQDIIKMVECDLGLNNLTNVVGSILYSGVKKGKYIKVGKAMYSLNKSNSGGSQAYSGIYADELKKLSNKLTKDLNTMSTSLLNAHIDGDLDESELSKYKVLKNISTLLDACVSYSTDSDLVALKGVIEGLK